MDNETRASRWRGWGASIQGARNQSRGIRCQDAVEVLSSPSMAVVAVADGHGHPRHARSDEGAAIAVSLMASLMESLGRDLLAEPRPVHHVTVERRMRSHLPGRLCWEWNRQVKVHAGFGADSDGSWHEELELYGTTVLGALIIEGLAVFVQLGDGDIFVVTEDGQVRRPFVADDEYVGAITQSLCQAGSARRVKVSCWELSPVAPRLLLLCTDGVTDSLQAEPDAVDSLGRWLVSRLASETWEPVIASLPEWLNELSHLGNGDDTTMGLVYWSMA